MSKELHADELFKEFKETSITEFFRKNRAHLGYSGKLRSLTTAVHELVTNSLDACEEAGILPEVFIEIKSLGKNHYLITSIDNGPGIPVKHIPNVFGKMLAGTKFHRNIQLRGQQGIGVAGVTLFSQITTGKPVKIRTSTGKGKVHEVELMVDITKNKADILSDNEYSEYWRGTEINCELGGVKFSLREQGPFEYIRRTAVANSHARIVFIDPEGRKTIFERSSEKIPKNPKAVKPHPQGMEVDDLLNMAKASKARKISSFLSSEFSRVSNAKVREMQKKVDFDLNKNPRRITWAECEQIVDAIDKMKFLAPSSEGLVPIGEKQIKAAVLNILDPEFDAVLTRSPGVHSGGVPFQVEVAIAFGGHAGRETSNGVKFEIMRFGNRAPLIFDAGGCVITQAVNSVEWKRYGIRDYENAPFTVFINLVSTHIPYISAGKQSVSDEEEITKEIRMALMEVGRKFSRYYSRKRNSEEKEKKRQILLKYSTELAAGLAALTKKDEKKILKGLYKLINERMLDSTEDEVDEVDEDVPDAFSDEEGGGKNGE
ncbi:MAG: DNA topoisomerase VI subunit B [Candidatus Altiarchaeales archaeon ex4484_2]|nr:MAG: DNA topoisomerase VI subunit B [Candidatus Altiarchaeales archaeon ex4484_2]